MDYLNQTQSYIENTADQWVVGVAEFSQRFAFRRLWAQDLAWERNNGTLKLKAYRFPLLAPSHA